MAAIQQALDRVARAVKLVTPRNEADQVNASLV